MAAEDDSSRKRGLAVRGESPPAEQHTSLQTQALHSSSACEQRRRQPHQAVVERHQQHQHQQQQSQQQPPCATAGLDDAVRADLTHNQVNFLAPPLVRSREEFELQQRRRLREDQWERKYEQGHNVEHAARTGVYLRDRLGLVPHIGQEENWDCGLACLKMVLHAARPGMDPARLTNTALLQITQTRSIWTVDLAYALRSFDIAFTFFTISSRVNKTAFHGLPFYKEIESDEERVNRCFNEAAQSSVQISVRSISGEELRDILIGRLPLTGRVPEQENEQRPSQQSTIEPRNRPARKMYTDGSRCAILLVDITLMRSYSRDHLKNEAGIGNYGRWFMQVLKDNIRNVITNHNNENYSGHYIVLVGYIEEADEYAYRDPASLAPLCFVDAEVLHKARKAVGTDEDIIFVELNGR